MSAQFDMFNLDHTSLPLQDEIREGESGQGYVLRMACGNGMAGLGQVAQMLGRTHAGATLLVDDAPQLAAWFGASVHRLAFALELMPTGRREQGSHYAGHALGRRYFLNRCHPRVCPDCLREYGYCRIAWDFSLTVACARHGRLLLERCPACGRGLQWNRPGLSACRCGYPWESLDVSEPPTPTEQMLANLFDHGVEDFDPGAYVLATDAASGSEEARVLSGILHNISIDGALRVVYALATAAAYDASLLAGPRERSQLAKARQTIAMAAALSVRIAHGESSTLRPHRPTVLIDLLGDAASFASSSHDDQSLAHSMMRWLLGYTPRSTIGSKHASLAQRVLF